MKTLTRIRARGVGRSNGFVVVAVAAVLVAAAAQPAPARPHVVVSGAADVRVWLDESWDIYPSFDDVVVSVRAARDCYATVMLVDTDGYLHVIYPTSMIEDGWLEGGVRYRFRCGDLGLDPYDMRGIAYVFAVGSPFPFVYAGYGDAVFAGRFGYRIYGDPYLACRQFYLSLLPARCNWEWVGVSYSRFYVREWVSYPAYLCMGHYGSAVHVGIGDRCPGCSQLCERYRHHVKDPYGVLRPTVRYKDAYAERTPTRIAKSVGPYKSAERAVRPEQARSLDRVHQSDRSTTHATHAARIVSGKRTDVAANTQRAVRKSSAVTGKSVTGKSVTGKSRAVVSRGTTPVARADRSARNYKVTGQAATKTYERPSSSSVRRESGRSEGKETDTNNSYKRRVKASN
jgi:hypothetical protein